MSDSISLMRRGALTEVLTVQNAVTTDLGGGSSTTAYTSQGTIRAEVEPLKGMEAIQARQVVGSVSYRVRTDYPLPTGTTLTSASRLVWKAPGGDRTLEAAEPPRLSASRRSLTLLCTEREVTA